MIRPLAAIIEHKRRLQKLLALPLSTPTKRHLLFDYIRHFVFPRLNSSQFQSRVAGYDVPFCTLGAFEYLFGEVFVKHSYWLDLPEQRPVILDAGSNIGMSVLFFHLLWPEASITAFEPQPSAFNCLSAFIQLNQLGAKVTAHQVALASKEGILDFFIDESSPGSLLASMDPDRMSKKRIPVNAKRLSEFIAGPIDLLKMDIEGAEMDVLVELVESSAITSVKRIVLEYHHHIDRDRDNFAKLIRLLENADFGYQIESKMSRPFPERRFQDMIIYAYSKRH